MNVKVCQRFWGGFLRKWAFFGLLLGCAFYANGQFRFVNDGAVISIKPGTRFIVNSSTNGSILTNNGYLSNESDSLYINGFFVNNDTTIGIDNAAFRLTRDWTNNGVFIGGASTVYRR